MSRILIIGGGFAGVTAAEMIAASVSDSHEVTLVSASRWFTFYPALVPVAFGRLPPEEVRTEMTVKLQERHIRFVEGEVLEIDPVARSVRVAGNDLDGDLHFDLLLIALGRRLATEKVPGFFEFSQHILGVGPAMRFKESIDAFRRGNIVVGLCQGSFLPVPVFESALSLAGRFASEIENGSVSVTALFPEKLERVLAGTDLLRDMRSELSGRGVRVIENFPVSALTDRAIKASDGSSVQFDLAMLMPPFRGQTPVQAMKPEEWDDGFARVDAGTRLAGFDGIYAAGDIISLPGPRFGYMAIRQARVAAANMIKEVSGESPDIEYVHRVEWILGRKYSHPELFHYGIWDSTLADYGDDDLLGMARPIRERYGKIAAGS